MRALMEKFSVMRDLIEKFTVTPSWYVIGTPALPPASLSLAEFKLSRNSSIQYYVILYWASMMCLGKAFVNEANKIIFDFIWKGKEKIKRL